jgi:hypothetical protein
MLQYPWALTHGAMVWYELVSCLPSLGRGQTQRASLAQRSGKKGNQRLRQCVIHAVQPLTVAFLVWARISTSMNLMAIVLILGDIIQKSSMLKHYYNHKIFLNVGNFIEVGELVLSRAYRPPKGIIECKAHEIFYSCVPYAFHV